MPSNDHGFQDLSPAARHLNAVRANRMIKHRHRLTNAERALGQAAKSIETIHRCATVGGCAAKEQLAGYHNMSHPQHQEAGRKSVHFRSHFQSRKNCPYCLNPRLERRGILYGF